MSKIEHIKGDIFSLIGYDIVFAIDSTFTCDVGICKQINDSYGVEKTLRAIPLEDSKWRGKGFCISFAKGAQNFHALVVKPLPQVYPEYENIKEALMSLAANISQKNNIITPKIAMPKVCCGNYDKREWPLIEDIIKKVFAGIDCDILIVEKE
jgi:hypothetical protein